MNGEAGRPWTRRGCAPARRDWPTGAGPAERTRLDSVIASSGASPATSHPFPAVHRLLAVQVLTIPVGLVVRVGAVGVPARSLRVSPRARPALRDPRRTVPRSRCLSVALHRPSSSPPTSPCRLMPGLWPVAWLAMALEDGDPDGLLTDAELTALALAADPDAPIAEGAVPIGDPPGPAGYGAAALVHATRGAPGGRRWKAPFVIAVVSAFLLIDSHGAVQYLRVARAGPRVPERPA